MLITSMNEQAARQICAWDYEYPYSVYNYWPYDEAVRTNARIINSKYNDEYLCFWNESEALIGYVSFIKNTDKLFLGIGLAPDYCSKGLGKKLLSQSIVLSKEKYSDDVEIWVQVRFWNERAIKCYSACGFELQYYKDLPDRWGKTEKFCFLKLKS